MIKYEAEKSNKGTSYLFSNVSIRSCRATLEFFMDSIERYHLTYNGDRWNNQTETEKDVFEKVNAGDYAICPRFVISKSFPTGEKGETLIFRVKHPSGGKVRLYIQLKEGESISFNLFEKLSPEEAAEFNTAYAISTVNILRHCLEYYVSNIEDVTGDET